MTSLPALALNASAYKIDMHGGEQVSLAIERIDGHLSISFDTEGFNEFIDRCFG